MKNTSIKVKLFAILGTVGIVSIVIFAVASYALTNAQKLFDTYVHETSSRLTEVNNVIDAVNSRAISARNLIVIRSPEQFENEKRLISASQTKIDSTLKVLETALSQRKDLSDESVLFRQIVGIETEYREVAKEIVSLFSQAKNDEAIVMINEKCRPLLTKLLSTLAQYTELIDKKAKKDVVNSEDENSFYTTFLLVVSLITITASSFAGYIVITRIVGSIAQAVKVAETVASGDLTSKIVVKADDETGLLLNSLQKMNSSLIEIVQKVNSSSDSIATGSTQIASGNLDLSQRTERQASSLQQTAASMEELSVTAKNNAESARQAVNLARNASQTAIAGGSVVSSVVDTMTQINDSSKKISSIIGVIDEIAFQTNILALNAAVEAARAAEHGRGFAVVASEVRSLAQRSATAAKEIKSLIGQSVERVDVGTQQVDLARATMSDIVDQVTNVTQLLESIGNASIQQTSGISEINKAVMSLDEVTQQNAALVEQSAAAAESLKQQSASLAETVSVFRT